MSFLEKIPSLIHICSNIQFYITKTKINKNVFNDFLYFVRFYMKKTLEKIFK